MDLEDHFNFLSTLDKKVEKEETKMRNKIIIYTARGMSTFSGNVHRIYSELYELTNP